MKRRHPSKNDHTTRRRTTRSPNRPKGHNSQRLTPHAPAGARELETRNRALHALALMRQGESLAEACRLEHVKPQTVLRYAGSAVRQDKPGGRFRAVATDRFIRTLEVLTAQGSVSVSVRGIKTARALSAYRNAVGHFNRTGDDSKLRPFKGKTFEADGRRHAFLTDPDALLTLAQADALRLDSLYASVSRRS